MDPASKSSDGKQLGLPKETADYISKILPVGTAYAAPEKAGIASVAPATADETRREALISQIPGAVSTSQTAQLPAGPAPTGNEIVKGTAKTAYALGHNLLALPAAGISTLARKGLGAMGFGPGADFEETLGRYSYSPDDAVSQQQLGGIGQAVSDLKIPAYIPMLGGIRGASKSGVAKDAAAIAKTKNLRLASSAPEEAAAAALKKTEASSFYPDPRLPGLSQEAQGVIKKHPDRVASEIAVAQKVYNENFAASDLAQATAAKAKATGIAGLATDEAAAIAARARLGTNAGAQVINETLPAISGRSLVGGSLATGVNAAGAYPDSAAAATAGGIPDLSTAQEDFRRAEIEQQNAAAQPSLAPDAAATAAAAAPAEKPSWLTNDRALNMGLQMMAGSGKPGSGSALRDLMQSAGAAGIGTLAQEREERKLKSTELENLARMEALKGQGRKFGAEADILESGQKGSVQAAGVAQARMKDFMGTMQGKLSDEATRNRLYNQFLMDAYNSLGIPPPTAAPAATPAARTGWGTATTG